MACSLRQALRPATPQRERYRSTTRLLLAPNGSVQWELSRHGQESANATKRGVVEAIAANIAAIGVYHVKYAGYVVNARWAFTEDEHFCAFKIGRRINQIAMAPPIGVCVED